MVDTSLLAQLAADAGRLERDGVTRGDVGRLAEDGLLAVYGPPDLGGRSDAAQRQVAEELAGASPDAWFVWFRHGPVVRLLRAATFQLVHSQAAHVRAATLDALVA